jgi:hypothetical protein
MKTNSFALVLAVVLAAGGVAEAQRPRPHGFGGEKFQANKKFGLGLELGDIFGVTGKVFVTDSQAIDFGVGDLYNGYYVDGNRGGLHLYADYLWHPFVITKAEAFELPFYVGVGGRFWEFDYACPGGTCTGASVFGVRVPLGVTFDFNNVPLDIFIQAVPTFDFYRGYNPHSFYLDVDFSVGIRYWFS